MADKETKTRWQMAAALRISLWMLVVLSLTLASSAIVPSSVSAQVFHDEFNALLEGNNIVEADPALNSGYTDNDNGTGPWYTYNNGWINQWFFNADDIVGSKTIEWQLGIEVLPPEPPPECPPGACSLIGTVPPTVDLAINWSDQLWNDVGNGGAAPPLPSDTDGDQFIVRETLLSLENLNQPILDNNVGDPLVIPDFNPQWVSIDVRVVLPGVYTWDDGLNSRIIEVTPQILLQGEIWHEHIPEPSCAALMSLAGVGLCFGARRRRKLAKT